MGDAFWVIWDLEPEMFALPDGSHVVGKPGDRIQIRENDDGTREVIAVEPAPLH